MLFNKHFNLEGQHAFLSPSKPAWLGYEEDKLDRVYIASLQAKRGSELHKFAADAIRLRQKLAPKKETLNMYVNDAIGFHMTPEVTLYYSENAFGHADAISFRKPARGPMLLRIHDLKTGLTLVSHHQLEIYAALFCLEYHINPFDIETILRIYQNNEIAEFVTDPDVIFHIMEKIKFFDRRLTTIKLEVES